MRLRPPKDCLDTCTNTELPVDLDSVEVVNVSKCSTLLYGLAYIQATRSVLPSAAIHAVHFLRKASGETQGVSCP